MEEVRLGVGWVWVGEVICRCEEIPNAKISPATIQRFVPPLEGYSSHVPDMTGGKYHTTSTDVSNHSTLKNLVH